MQTIQVPLPLNAKQIATVVDMLKARGRAVVQQCSQCTALKERQMTAAGRRFRPIPTYP